ncbi:MAG: hypothetical protein QXW94_05165 [Desulfurococcaceae archaeon]
MVNAATLLTGQGTSTYLPAESTTLKAAGWGGAVGVVGWVGVVGVVG